IPRASSGSFFAPNKTRIISRMTIKSGPAKFMKLARRLIRCYQDQALSGSCKAISACGIEASVIDRASLLWEKHFLCDLFGKAASALGWFIFPWRFIRPRAKKSLAFDSFGPAISAQSDTKRWQKPTLKKFQPTKS